jgi:hypothetical protein
LATFKCNNFACVKSCPKGCYFWATFKKKAQDLKKVAQLAKFRPNDKNVATFSRKKAQASPKVALLAKKFPQTAKIRPIMITLYQSTR